MQATIQVRDSTLFYNEPKKGHYWNPAANKVLEDFIQQNNLSLFFEFKDPNPELHYGRGYAMLLAENKGSIFVVTTYDATFGGGGFTGEQILQFSGTNELSELVEKLQRDYNQSPELMSEVVQQQ